MLAERAGYRVHVVAGDAGNIKITSATDVSAAMQRLDGMPSGASASSASATICTSLVEGRPLILAGGLDSVRARRARSLGRRRRVSRRDRRNPRRRGLGDIGHFPDTDARWKDASSVVLLNGSSRWCGGGVCTSRTSTSSSCSNGRSSARIEVRWGSPGRRGSRHRREAG